MKEETIKEEMIRLGDQKVPLEKSATEWQVFLSYGQLSKGKEGDFSLLEMDHPLFLPSTIHKEAEGLRISYALPSMSRSFDQIKEESVVEKLSFSLKVLDLEEILFLPVTTVLDPANLFIHEDGSIQVAYRALPGLMEPESLTERDFLNSWKAILAALFTEARYSKLNQGGLESSQLPSFVEELSKVSTIDEARNHTRQAYEEERAKEEKTTVRVNKLHHRIFKFSTIWLSALSVLLILPLLYMVFISSPFKERLLKADTAYLKLDYSGVIEVLNPVAVKDLPLTQKVELATAYIKGLSFSDDQRQVILNNVTFKSDELYLDYWIQVGRKDLDAALDSGKRLDDSDLIIYALVQKIKEVREDDKLSGKEREEKLNTLQGDYKKYWDERSSLLEGDKKSDDSTKQSGTSTSSAPQASSSAPVASSSETQASSNQATQASSSN